MVQEKGLYSNHRLNNTEVYNKPCTGDSGHMDGWSNVYVYGNPVNHMRYWQRDFMIITD